MEFKDEFMKVLNGTFFECSSYIEMGENVNYFCNLMLSYGKWQTSNICPAFFVSKDKVAVSIRSKTYEVDINEECRADQVLHELLYNHIYAVVNEEFENCSLMTRNHGIDIRVDPVTKNIYEYCGKVANDHRSAYRRISTNQIYLFEEADINERLQPN